MRYASIDILRTVAIVLMVLVHFMENLSGSDWAPAGLGAPLFTFLVGVSYRLWLNGQEARGQEEGEISKVTIRRGLFLIALGFAFNVFVWLPEDTYNWDVLTFIGTAFLVLNVFRHVPLVIPVFGGCVAFALAPVLRAMTDYDAYWVNGYFEGDLTLSDVFIGFFANGFFPLLPWIVYPLAGFVTASVLFAEPERVKETTRRAALVGLALIAASALLRLSRPYTPESLSRHFLTGWTMFPPSVEYVLGTLGVALFLFALGHRWVDQHPRLVNHQVVRVVFTTFSKYSLTIYLLHHVVHLWPLWIYGAAFGDEPTQFWRAALPVTVSVPLAALFLAACFVVCRWMERTERRGVEGWMRHLCG